MSKIIVIGDIHGRRDWWDIVLREHDADLTVFLGDYFDNYDPKTKTQKYTGAEQIRNFEELMCFKNYKRKKVVMLIGNHDHHYFNGMKGKTTGFQMDHAAFIQRALEDNIHNLQMAHSVDNYLFSHAGITEDWLNDILGKDGWDVENLATEVNEIWKYKPKAFMFNESCWNKYGDDVNQSPCWIRPKSLMKGAKNFKKRWTQIVGHTWQNQIDIKGKATGKRYYFIDTLATSGEYLIIENNIITSKTIKDES